MQPSVRPATPSIVNARSNSNHSLQNGQDVSASPRTNSIKAFGNKSIGYWKPTIPTDQLRSQTSHGPSSLISSAPQLNRWNSESRMAARARASRHDPARAMLGPGALDIDLLESNRESMKALSDFLRTKARDLIPFWCVISNQNLLLRPHRQIISCQSLNPMRGAFTQSRNRL